MSSSNSQPLPGLEWWEKEGLTETEALNFDRHFFLRRKKIPDDVERGTSSDVSSWVCSTYARFIWLTIVLLGVQATWSLEFSYGTPYLKSLGVSETIAFLIWAAGPLSGLIMQPIVGAVSDRCTLRMGRRRPFLMGGALGVVLSLLLIGWNEELVEVLKGENYLKIIFAVVGFVFVDLFMNMMQAVSRALIVDVLPVNLQEAGSAWAGRMVGMGSVLGYLLGQANLVEIFPFLGTKQLKIFCVLCCLLLTVTVGTTCLMISEVPYHKDHTTLNQEQVLGFPKEKKIFSALPQAVQMVKNLPKFYLNLLRVQIFAWVAWYPILFFTTTWVGKFIPGNKSGSHDIVGEKAIPGTRALLINSVVAAISSFVLPHFCRPSSPSVQELPSWPERVCIFLRIIKKPEIGSPRASFLGQLPTLPQIFTLSLIMLGVQLFMSMMVNSVFWATVLIAFCGVPWAVAVWAPFALIGELVQSHNDIAYHPVLASSQDHQSSTPSTKPLEAGMLLGIHNVAIVVPQLAMCAIGAIISEIDKERSLGIVFLFGGVMALFAAFFSTKLWR